MSDPRIAQGGADTSEALSLGLAANGSAGSWYVDVDETTAGPQRWFIQVEGPSVYLYFEIASPATAAEVLRFLDSESPPATGPQLQVAAGPQPLAMLRDDEFGDTSSVVLGASPGPVARFTLEPEDLDDLAEALRQACDALRAAGLLGGTDGH